MSKIRSRIKVTVIGRQPSKSVYSATRVNAHQHPAPLPKLAATHEPTLAAPAAASIEPYADLTSAPRREREPLLSRRKSLCQRRPRRKFPVQRDS